MSKRAGPRDSTWVVALALVILLAGLAGSASAAIVGLERVAPTSASNSSNKGVTATPRQERPRHRRRDTRWRRGGRAGGRSPQWRADERHRDRVRERDRVLRKLERGRLRDLRQPVIAASGSRSGSSSSALLIRLDLVGAAPAGLA
jgi:hypothetical protein